MTKNFDTHEVFTLTNTNFSNGISENSKNWLPYSARFTRNLAIFEDSDSCTLTPMPVLDSGVVVTDLVKNMIDAYPYETARYAYGDSGNIYRIASNTWALDHTVASGSPAGQGMVMLVDALYGASSTAIWRKFSLSSGSGIYNDDFFSDGIQNVDINFTASGQTYAVPVSITENTANTLYFGSGGNGNTSKFAYDPIKTIQLYVTSKGTGAMVLTLHDSNNTNLGSVTVANGSLTNGQMNSFTFATPINIQIGQTYHCHITQSSADGTIQTGSSSDFSTAQVKTLFGILVADSNYHPMIQHTNGVTAIWVVGNGHYLGVFDGTTYNPNKITLEPGFNIRTIAKINENIVAYAWKGSNIDDYEYGRAYIWDGIQNYFNYSRELTQGTPNSIGNFKNRMFGIFGSRGEIEIAPDEASPFRQIQKAPKLTTGSRVEVLPNAMGVWQARCLFGYSNTNDPNTGVYNDPSAGNHVTGDTYVPPVGMEQGIYEFGNQSDRAITYTAVSTEVLNFAFQPSTPIANPTAFKIGCIFPVGKDCYAAYKDGSIYYVDRITKGNNPVSFGSWESLISDRSFDKYDQFQQMPQKFKLGVRVRVSFAALPTGCTVTAKIRADRASAWTFGNTTTSTTSPNTTATVLLGGGGLRYKEIEYGFDVTAATNYPTILGVEWFFYPLQNETDNSQL